MSKITIFENITSSKNPFYIQLETEIERIRGGKSRNLIDMIRVLPEKKDRDALKQKLPSVCFSGTFSKRGNNAILQHSGIVAIDFDHLNERLPELRLKLEKDPYTLACFLSPSGDGLKLLVKIPPNMKTHAGSCRALKDYYSDNALDSFEDVARVCYESYDPNIFYNTNSDVFDEVKEAVVFASVVNHNPISTDEGRIYDRLKVWLENKGEYYMDGNKHSFLVKLAGACSRFGLGKETTARFFIYDYQNAASPVNPQDIEDIVSRVYRTYGAKFGTAYFAENEQPYAKRAEKVKSEDPLEAITDDVFDVTIPAKDIIYLNNIRDQMWHNFHNGVAKGETTYFDTINPIWTWRRGELTLMHGIGNHGKSTLMLQLMLIKSVKEGMKWAVFSPEQNPPVDFYDDLIHTYVGKNTQKHFRNQMSEEEYNKGMDFVSEHFFFVYPEENDPTPEYINKRFAEAIYKHHVDGCLIDPYNQLEVDLRKKGGREDQYLSSFLSAQKRFALKYNIYMLLIAHPNSGVDKSKKGYNEGNYECPNVYDLSGGAMWNNKCDNILVTYRPYFITNSGDTTVEFRSQKIKKQKLVGIPGTSTLTFDRPTNRFIDNGKSPFDEIPKQIIRTPYKDYPDEHLPF